MSPHYLSHLFTPRSIALAGIRSASTLWGAWCSRTYAQRVFTACLYPLNPKHASVFGSRGGFCRTEDLPEAPELLVIASPAQSVILLIGSGSETRNAARLGLVRRIC